MRYKYWYMSNDQSKNNSRLPSISDLLAGRKPPMRGLGDAIARVTDALHIPKCGSCAERQEMLNKAVPFGKKPH